MHSAFDVAFANVKLSNIPSARREPKLEVVPERVASKRYGVLAVCAMVLVGSSVHGRLEYMGTVVNIAVLEVTPLLAVALEHRGQRQHAAVLASCAGLGLFAWRTDTLRQPLLGYPIYGGLLVVLALQGWALGKQRPLDLVLAVCSGLAIASALLLRHVITQVLLVQVVEMSLLILCAGAYWQLHARAG
jgi:hypothetical protein